MAVCVRVHGLCSEFGISCESEQTVKVTVNKH